MLIGITLIVYLRVKDHEFVGYDENRYLTSNTHGGNWSNVVWAFTTYEFANWHPLTWLSDMLDCRLFGLNSSRHHVMNLILYLANVVLSSGLLQLMTAGTERFRCRTFAVHPLIAEC